MKKIGKPGVVFLGAGASRSAGIPTANEIVEYILNDKDLKQLLSSTEQSEYFEVMADLDSGERHRLLKNFIDRSKINTTHLVVALLASLGYIDCIITTNFDPLIRRALIFCLYDIPIIDVANNRKLTHKEIAYPCVFHMHGTVENAWQFNTREELDSKKDEISSIIQRVAKGRTWVVVGYGGGDEPVFNELCKFERFEEGLFWVGYNNRKPSQKLDRLIFSKKNKNAHYISGYDSDSFFQKLYDQLIENLKAENIVLLKSRKAMSEITDPALEDIITNVKLNKTAQSWLKNEIDRASTHSFEAASISFFEKIKKVFYPSYFRSNKVINQAIDLIKSSKFEMAIKFIRNEINSNKENPQYHYYYALALAEQARGIEPVANRKENYEKFRKSLMTARELFAEMEVTPFEAESVNPLLLNTWGREHNDALPYATDDSVMATVDEPLKRAVAHLENSIIVNPDATLSYDVLSQIHFMDNNYVAAAEVLEQSMELKDPPPVEDYDRISVYYGQSGNSKKAVEILKTGLEHYPDSVGLTQKLADNYMNIGEREHAIEVLEGLIKDDPANAEYRLVLGTGLLSITESLTSSISDLYEEINNLKNELRGALEEEAVNIEEQMADIDEEIENQTQKVNGLNDRAQEALLKTIRLRPNDEQAHNALGVLYQNKAALIFTEKNNTDILERVKELDEIARGFLMDAMEYFEKTVDINSENMGAWQSLNNIYINLDMPDKAQESQEKLGE